MYVYIYIYSLVKVMLSWKSSQLKTKPTKSRRASADQQVVIHLQFEQLKQKKKTTEGSE